MKQALGMFNVGKVCINQANENFANTFLKSWNECVNLFSFNLLMILKIAINYKWKKRYVWKFFYGFKDMLMNSEGFLNKLCKFFFQFAFSKHALHNKIMAKIEWE